MNQRSCFCLLLALLTVCPLSAGEENRIIDLPELLIRGGEPLEVKAFEPVPGGQLPPFRAGAGNLALGLDRLPGVDLGRRGAHAFEPVLRGLGGDRVATRCNGLLLPNASPTRTAAPVNFFDDTGFFRVEVSRSFPRLSDGPVESGGLIRLRPDLAAADRAARAWVEADPGREGWSAGSLGGWSRDQDRFLAAGRYADHGDYESGNGRSVDADYRGWNLSAAGRIQTGERQTLYWTGHYARQDLARNSSLPLDTKDSGYWLVSLEHVTRMADASLRLRGGYARADPFLTSEDRRSVPDSPVALVEAHTPTRAASFSTVLEGAPAAAVRVRSGLDLDWQSRDALRTRDLVSGNRFRDRIWPDVEQWRPGAFLEAEGDADPGLSWRAGLRVERTMSQAHAADDPVEGFPGAPADSIRDTYAAFSGPDAADTDRDDWTGAGQMVLEKALRPGLSLSGGLAYTVAPPGVGERYRAFVAALGGGFEIGNPALDPEHKREGFVRLNASSEAFDFGVEVFLADFEDYVQRQAVGLVRDVRVYSFRNIDARFHGAELGAVWRVLDGAQHTLTMPLTFAVTKGKNRDRGRDLPEVPPWEGSLALRYERTSGWGRASAEIGARYVDAQDNPDPDINPVFTNAKSHTLIRLSFGIERPGSWRAGLDVDNLFDRPAYDYLQPPVASGAFGPSSGSLAQGERIPLPGREVRIWFSKNF